MEKNVIYFGKKVKIFCDGKCEKAWGINGRPKIQLDENNDDDFVYLSDNELGIAPEEPGTYEGVDTKPLSNEEKLNRWCCRECERCGMTDINIPIEPKNFNKRVYNITKY